MKAVIPSFLWRLSLLAFGVVCPRMILLACKTCVFCYGYLLFSRCSMVFVTVVCPHMSWIGWHGMGFLVLRKGFGMTVAMMTCMFA